MSEDYQGHERFMHRCIELANEAKHQGNTPVGSVVVLDGETTGEVMEQLPISLLLTGHPEALGRDRSERPIDSRDRRIATADLGIDTRAASPTRFAYC